jgi:hypothetical protein
VSIELQSAADQSTTYANVTDVSMGGCYVETSTILAPGSKLKLGFSMDDPTLFADGVVARLDPGTGIAIQFREMNREARERMFRILEFVQKNTASYTARYLASLTKN